MDHVYHGKTTWQPSSNPERGVIEAAEIEEIARLICDEAGSKKLAVAGYSMGGRYAMTLASRLADRLDALLFARARGYQPKFTLPLCSQNEFREKSHGANHCKSCFRLPPA